ncbi:hypothetical protein ACL9RF_02685 [Sphingobacterium sp. Mn56C]|uniref:hypothetical protein n=1 Tax=Sphingobacterium sp. Mn56C TaxID=3395261 RepID=UPI003BCA6A55
MKKVILIGLTLVMFSCKTLLYGSDPKFSLGMLETEFVNKNKNSVDLVFGDKSGINIYQSYNSLRGVYRFFVFQNEKLVRYETGSYADDYKLIHY